MFQGHGTYEWENGDFYEGMWKNGKPDGNGVFTSKMVIITLEDFPRPKMVMENTLERLILMMKIGMKIKWMEEEGITGQEKVLDGLFKEGQFTNIEIGTPAESQKSFQSNYLVSF